jgi:hypothetical protein
MKKDVSVLGFVKCLIKKFFFIKEKTDIYHKCSEKTNSSFENNEKEIEEVLNTYRSTTRWQTL